MKREGRNHRSKLDEAKMAFQATVENDNLLKSRTEPEPVRDFN